MRGTVFEKFFVSSGVDSMQKNTSVSARELVNTFEFTSVAKLNSKIQFLRPKCKKKLPRTILPKKHIDRNYCNTKKLVYFRGKYS